ncbi:GNAT family N-acetyltransferase [Streptomyces peucetius]|uniref:GNAT family N-acetyltransferase n=1 Tax=Streptomyces peucetius TaxID=1950 RepID=A0ABY6IKB5_STRPE|nr:GNAT family N-acetyltransferase [Streptomyces peucetius]UYQ66145.1 GNAT family N-acetyltransferase [Streptomyces peucetius]
MPRLERLTAAHAPALLAFEQENRAYFAASIPDRGDDYFTHFMARHSALLAEQAAGVCHFHVLADPSGAILGRVNLVDVADGSAELGFRIAESAAGAGLATAAVREICDLAATRYGLTELRAAAALDNTGSRTVLKRTGFTETGSTVLAGRPGLLHTRRLP